MAFPLEGRRRSGAGEVAQRLHPKLAENSVDIGQCLVADVPRLQTGNLGASQCAQFAEGPHFKLDAGSRQLLAGERAETTPVEGREDFFDGSLVTETDELGFGQSRRLGALQVVLQDRFGHVYDTLRVFFVDDPEDLLAIAIDRSGIIRTGKVDDPLRENETVGLVRQLDDDNLRGGAIGLRWEVNVHATVLSETVYSKK